jgi:hypothetical protein
LTSTDLEELEARLHTERDAVLDAIRARLAGRGQTHHRELIDELIILLPVAGGAAARLLTATDAVLLGPSWPSWGDRCGAQAHRFRRRRAVRPCGGPIPLARLRRRRPC